MIKVHMTGAEDIEGPWNIALAGAGGSGKTLFASTAPDPLFVFFRENPTLKSVASRAIQYVKLINETEIDGSLTVAAHEKLHAVIAHVTLNPDMHKTLVIDTGDELFQAMKSARTIRQGGEFGPGDWNWLADTWREVLESLTALDMDVLMLFHMKSSRLDDTGIYRELMLQGNATDETSTWFDVVAAIDTFETVDPDGRGQTKRALLTHSSRVYPWVVDRSGNMDPRFEISTDFVGDYDRLKTILTMSPAIKHHAAEVGEIPDSTAVEDVRSDAEVPSPEELEAAKGTTKTTQEILENSTPVADEPVVEAAKTDDEAPIPSPTPILAGVEDQEEQPVTVEAAEANVEEILDGVAAITCSEEDCEVVLDEDMVEISEIRYRRPLCRDHFKAQSLS